MEIIRPTGAHGRTVYVVEDDDSVRRSIQRVLRSAGFSVQTFESAEAFQAASLPLEHACLVLDVHLGGMSGPELRDILAKAGSPLPIVFITAHDDERTRALVNAHGNRAWLVQKPFDPPRLLSFINEAFDSRA